MNMIWQLKGLFIALVLDIVFTIIIKLPMVFSIGWLIAMITDYKSLREIRK